MPAEETAQQQPAEKPGNDNKKPPVLADLEPTADDEVGGGSARDANLFS